MMELREKIAGMIFDAPLNPSDKACHAIADAILAIPEIAEAADLLRECAEFLEHEGASTEAKESDALSKRCAAMARGLAAQ